MGHVGRRRAVAGIAEIGLLLAACSGGAGEAGPGAEGAGVPDVAATVDTTTSGPASPTLEVLVSAAGGGGLVDRVEIRELQTDVGSSSTTFDVVLMHGAGEANSVRFRDTGDNWTTDLGDGWILVGPQCGPAVTCPEDDPVRLVDLTTNGATSVGFGLRHPQGGAKLPAEIEASIDAEFVFESDRLDPRPLAIDVLIRADDQQPRPVGVTTPVATPHKPVTAIGGGFSLLGFPFVGVADNAGELAALLGPSASVVGVESLPVVWDLQVVVVFTIGTNLCPPVLDSLSIESGVATPVFVNPGYFACEDPLVAHTAIAAVDRAFLADVDSVILPGSIGNGPDVSVDLAISPAQATDAAEPPPADDFEEEIGRVELPSRGEAATATSGTGGPLILVHHHDGTVSAIEPIAESNWEGPALLIPTFNGQTRTFVGRGAWDEYGRRLDGSRETDMRTFATRVEGDTVVIGPAVPTPAGSPITTATDPPATRDQTWAIDRADLLTVEQAVATAVGTTSAIDASVVFDDAGALLCFLPPDFGFPIEPCPDGSPPVAGIEIEAGFRNVHFGPLVATRTDDGFERVVTSGGSAGMRIQR